MVPWAYQLAILNNTSIDSADVTKYTFVTNGQTVRPTDSMYTERSLYQ